MNIIDLFSGCGGLSLGFELAGYNTLLGIDNDKAAINTFEKNHKGSIGITTDITEVSGEEIRRLVGGKSIDVVIGGPPCQGMSLAGPRKLHDPRNKLYLSFIRIVQELQPKAFVIENVPGLVSLFKGAIKESILEEFQQMGYNVNYQILNSADYGVPQTRKRVFFVGLKNGEKFTFPEPTYFEDGTLFDKSFIPLKEVIFPENEIDEKYYFSQKAVEGMLNAKKDMNKGRAQDINKPCNTVGAHLAKVSLNSTDPVLKINEKYRRFTPREVARIQSFPDSYKLVRAEGTQYKALGNAIPPVLMWNVGMKLADALTEYVNSDQCTTKIQLIS